MSQVLFLYFKYISVETNTSGNQRKEQLHPCREKKKAQNLKLHVNNVRNDFMWGSRKFFIGEGKFARGGGRGSMHILL